jgi:hypothetical protein
MVSFEFVLRLGPPDVQLETMSTHYNLRLQCSAVTSIEPTIPGALAESPLTELSVYQTPVPSPTKEPFPQGSESVLRPVHSYSNVVRTRTDSSQTREETGSVNATGVITSSEEGEDTITSAPVNVMKPELATSSDEERGTAYKLRLKPFGSNIP